MANKLYNESDIQAIANAIRSKNGSSDTYTVSDMATAISNIPTGGGGSNITIAANRSLIQNPQQGDICVEYECFNDAFTTPFYGGNLVFNTNLYMPYPVQSQASGSLDGGNPGINLQMMITPSYATFYSTTLGLDLYYNSPDGGMTYVLTQANPGPEITIPQWTQGYTATGDFANLINYFAYINYEFFTGVYVYDGTQWQTYYTNQV